MVVFSQSSYWHESSNDKGKLFHLKIIKTNCTCILSPDETLMCILRWNELVLDSVMNKKCREQSTQAR